MSPDSTTNFRSGIDFQTNNHNQDSKFKRAHFDAKMNGSRRDTSCSDENHGLPPSCMTSQQIYEIILGSGKTGESSDYVRQQPPFLQNENTVSPTTVDDVRPELQQHPVNTVPLPSQSVISNTANSANIDINSTLSMLLQQN